MFFFIKFLKLNLSGIKMKHFVFLYPIPEIIDFEIENHGWSEEGGADAFKQKYKSLLNRCIDVRYRQKGFDINYVIFDGSSVSDVIELRETDRIIKVGLDFKTHTTKHLYPDPDFILDQLGDVKIIRIAGFHLWDCVEKLARRAYERELDTLVDEDLTELFASRIKDPDFRIDKYPTYNPRKYGDSMFEIFMEARRNKPWLWQDY